MAVEEQDLLRRSLFEVLLALVRIMLRCGVSYPEFAEICKRSFICAVRSQRPNCKPIGIARTALVTGLSRREVKRILEGELGSRDPHVQRSPAAKLLHYWYTDPQYLDDFHRPKALSFVGPQNAFDSLVRRVAIDVPVGALRASLLQAGAVEERDDGTLVPVQRHFVPRELDEKILEGLNFGACNLMETLEFNTSLAPNVETRLQREVHSSEIPAELLDETRACLERSLGDLSVELDDYLGQPHWDRVGGEYEERVSLGVGLYYVDEDVPFD